MISILYLKFLWIELCRLINILFISNVWHIIHNSMAILSKAYTDHSVRVTVVSELHNQGFKTSQITQITRHKSRESVARYIRHTRDEARRNLSDALNRGLSMEVCTISKKQESTEVSIVV